MSAEKELKHGIEFGLYLVFTLILVFPDKVPSQIVKYFANPVLQIVLLVIVFILMYLFDPLLGLFASLVFLFLWSINFRKVLPEGFNSYVLSANPNAMMTRMVPEENRNSKWYIEKVLNEQPYIIEEDLVQTSSIQDDSGRGQNNSHLSR
jgi:hypothetical protein